MSILVENMGQECRHMVFEEQPDLDEFLKNAVMV